MKKDILLFRKYGLVACIVALLFVLAGCSLPASQESADTNQEGSGTEEAAENLVPTEYKAAQAYAEVLGNTEAYYSDEESSQTSQHAQMYTYALIPVEGYETPLLLLSKNNFVGFTQVKICSYNEELDSVEVSSDIISVGMSAAGALRTCLELANDGHHILYGTVYGTTGDADCSEVSIEDGQLKMDTIWTGSVAEPTESVSPIADSISIDWFDIADMKPLIDYGGGIVGITETIDDDTKSLVLEQQNEGKIVLEGTIKQLDDDAIAELQGIENPNPPSDLVGNIVHTVFVLSPEKTINATSVGMPSTKPFPYRGNMVHMIRLKDFPAETQVSEDPVIMSFDKDYLLWPSDTSLPLGEPVALEYEIIG